MNWAFLTCQAPSTMEVLRALPLNDLDNHEVCVIRLPMNNS